MNTKVISSQILAIILSLGLCSFQSPTDCNCCKSTSGTFSVYDYEEIPEISPAPEGFKPFYISHFGRHGARYCISEYGTLYDLLLKAEQKKLLTSEGKDFFARYEIFYQNVYSFKGNLTETGKAQLKAIADHMFTRFPDVFDGPTTINASSTESARVIMSMWSCLSQLQALDNDIVINANASASFASWLQPSLSSNPYYYNNAFKCSPAAEAAANEYFLKTVPWKKIVTRYFISPDALSEKLKVSPEKFIEVLSYVVFGSECLDNNNDCFDDVFSPEDKYQLWKGLSAKYFINNARFKEAKRMSVDYAAFTLAQIIETAQKDMEDGQTNLRLRFSHDSSIAPLLVFLDINGCGRETDSLEESLDIFPSYNIPMGASLQFVFYKNQDGQIIIRALLNESDASLPLTPYSGTFYKWEDFKTYYLPLIETSVQKIKSEKAFSQAEWNWKSIGDGAFAGLLGLQNALNLDGGGSSVLWTKEYGVISYPYDNRRYDHFGQRVVPNIIYLKNIYK